MIPVPWRKKISTENFAGIFSKFIGFAIICLSHIIYAWKGYEKDGDCLFFRPYLHPLLFMVQWEKRKKNIHEAGRII